MDTGQRPLSPATRMPEHYQEHIRPSSGASSAAPRGATTEGGGGKGPPSQGRLATSEGAVRGGFYTRSAHGETPDLFSAMEANSYPIPPALPPPADREFLFPAGERERRKTSLPGSLRWSRTASDSSVGPPMAEKGRPGSRLHHKFRSHSVCVTDPVCRSAYDSLPKSPATSFLAQFAQPDDLQGSPEFTDGSVIDRYRLGKVIGRGSFSECREGMPIDPDPASPYDRVALKIVRSDPYSSECLSDFDRELSMWRRLKHRNILPLLDCLKFDNARVAVSPVAENGSLLNYITTHGPISEAQARVLFRQIVEAVGHMHQQQRIVHRDIKLDNILLDSQLRPYICDFGLSEYAQEQQQQQSSEGGDADSTNNSGSRASSQLDLNSPSCGKQRSESDVFCKGSLWYLPPEELDPNFAPPGAGTIKEPRDDGRSSSTATHLSKGDIWALGVVLYGMIMGQLPFSDDYLPRLQVAVTKGSYAPLPSSCSDELKDMISRLLTVDFRQRPDIEQVRQHPWLTGKGM